MRQISADLDIESNMLKRSPKALTSSVAACIGVSMLGACSESELAFVPDCVAFEGETILIEGDRFEWRRFTDMIRIGPDGEPVEPFPGFPKHGTVAIDGERVVFTSDEGERLPHRFLVEADGRRYLLTAAEHDAWRARATLPDCPLVAESRPD